MEIGQFFENYLKRESIFKDKQVLQAHYLPDEIFYREEQLTTIANILAPSLRGEKPSNLFIYGKTGTGKTLTIKHILQSLDQAAEKNNVALKTIYINCKLKRIADTEYRLLTQLIKAFGKDIPSTGLPTDEVYNIFYGLLDQDKQVIIMVLDEIDQLVSKIGDEVLYNFTRINSELKHSQITVVGISNNLTFAEHLDPRVKSSLSEEELIFPPYNALQIKEILSDRAAKVLKDGVIDVGVIEKCSAYAAREHGDVRRAIDLLRVSAELTERKGDSRITIAHLDEAEKKIESEKILNAIINQPKQFQLVVYAIFILSSMRSQFFTGEIYDVYQGLCKKVHLTPLTQRRVSDILSELDMLGVINAKIISKGRYGRMREIRLSIDNPTTIKVRELLEKSLSIS
jgi:cell division control protein 6